MGGTFLSKPSELRWSKLKGPEQSASHLIQNCNLNASVVLEQDPRKIQWNKLLDDFFEEHNDPCCFDDIETLARRTCTCVAHPDRNCKPMPGAACGEVGFSCKTVSGLFNGTGGLPREDFLKLLIDNALGSTGKTFGGMVGSMSEEEPMWLVWENVEAIGDRLVFMLVQSHEASSSTIIIKSNRSQCRCSSQWIFSSQWVCSSEWICSSQCKCSSLWVCSSQRICSCQWICRSQWIYSSQWINSPQAEKLTDVETTLQF